MSTPFPKVRGPQQDRWGIIPQTEGYQPRARIWVQCIRWSDAARDFITVPNDLVVEIRDWSSWNISRSLNGEGTMTVTLPNPRDKYYRIRGNRTEFRSNDQTGKGEILQAHLNNLISVCLPDINPRNPEKLASSFEAYKQRWLNWIWRPGIGPHSGVEGRAFFRDQAGNTGLGLMQRIFLDIQGEDGLWYAGFSGIISKIDDSYQVEGEPTLVLACKDMLRLFSMSEILTTAAVWTLLIPEIQQRQNADASPAWSNILATEKASDLIVRVSKIVQETYCYPAALLAAQDLAVELAFSEDHFWFKENFWDFGEASTESIALYETPPSSLFDLPGAEPAVPIPTGGMQTIRRYDGVPYDGADCLRRIRGKTPGAGIDEETTLDMLRANIWIDAYARESQETHIYQQAIKSVFDLFQPQKTRADAICRRVAEFTYSDWFATTNGDIVYQATKLNNIPGSIATVTREVPVDRTKPSAKKRILGRKPMSLARPIISPEISYDFSPAPEYMPVKAHRLNYVITDFTLKGWTLSESEETIFNFVQAPAGFEMEVPSGPILNVTVLTGVAGNSESQWRYGVRLVESSRIYNNTLLSGKDQKGISIGRPLLDLIAQLLLVKLQYRADTGTVHLRNRPDLDLGKTLLLFERQKLGYIDSLSLTLTKGQSISVTLGLTYVHDLSDAVPNPWVIVREQFPARTEDIVSTPPSAQVSAGGPILGGAGQ